MRLFTFAAVAVLVMAAGPSFAGTFNVYEAGTYAGNVPATTYSAPNGTFTLSYTIDTSTLVFSNSIGFDPTVSNVVYRLNGNAVSLTSPLVGFATGGSDYIEFSFNPAGPYFTDAFLPLTSVPWSGPNSAPVVNPGTYHPVNGSDFVAPAPYGAYEVDYSEVTITATPEPNTFLLALTGLAGTAGLALRRRSLLSA